MECFSSFHTIIGCCNVHAYCVCCSTMLKHCYVPATRYVGNHACWTGSVYSRRTPVTNKNSSSVEIAWPHIWTCFLPPLFFSFFATACQRGFPAAIQSCFNQPHVTTEHVLCAPRFKSPPPTHTQTQAHTRKCTLLYYNSPHTRTPSTTKTNTCKHVTLRGCNLQENPIWQSSCQRGSQIDCSCGAHRVASCPSTLFYQAELPTTHPPRNRNTHLKTSLRWDQAVPLWW